MQTTLSEVSNAIRVPMNGTARPEIEAKRVITASAELSLEELKALATFLDTVPYRKAFSAKTRVEVAAARDLLLSAVLRMNEGLEEAERRAA